MRNLNTFACTAYRGIPSTSSIANSGLKRLQQLLRRGLEETAALFPPVREAYKWVKRVARILKNREQLPAAKVRRRLVQLLVRMRQAAAATDDRKIAGPPQAIRRYFFGRIAAEELIVACRLRA